MTCGDKLRDMNNVLVPKEYIDDSVSEGPNNYAYRTLNARTPERKTRTKYEE